MSENETVEDTEEVLGLGEKKQIEEVVKLLRQELQSYKEQNLNLIKNIQDYKMKICSYEKANLEMTQNQLKLNFELNYLKMELSRAYTVIGVSEDRITGAFTNVLKMSQILSYCKILLTMISSSRSEPCETQKLRTNSLPAVSINGQKNSGSQTKHRVRPMVKGLTIFKPTIKLQRVMIPSQNISENERNGSTDVTYIEDMDFQVANTAHSVIDRPLSVANTTSLVENSIHPVENSTLSVVDQALPVLESTVNSQTDNEHILAKCDMHLFALEEKLNLTFKYLTEVSKNLVDGKEAIKEYHSTPAGLVNDLFISSSESSSSNSSEDFSPQNQIYVNQSSLRVGPMVEGHSIFTKPTIMVERVDASTVIQNSPQAVNQSSQRVSTVVEAHSVITNPTVLVERLDDSRVTENRPQAVNQSNQRVSTVGEAHSVITNPTIMVERLDDSRVTQNRPQAVNQSSQGVSTVVEAHSVITNPTILVERLDLSRVTQNRPQAVNQSSQRVSTVVEAHSVITNPTVLVERLDDSRVTQNRPQAVNQSSQRVSTVVEAHSVITNPTILVERLDDSRVTQNRPQAGPSNESLSSHHFMPVTYEDSDEEELETGDENQMLPISEDEEYLYTSPTDIQFSPIVEESEEEAEESEVETQIIPVPEDTSRANTTTFLEPVSDRRLRLRKDKTPKEKPKKKGKKKPVVVSQDPVAGNVTPNIEMEEQSTSAETRTHNQRKRVKITQSKEASSNIQDPGGSNTTPITHLEKQSASTKAKKNGHKKRRIHSLSNDKDPSHNNEEDEEEQPANRFRRRLGEISYKEPNNRVKLRRK